MDRIGENVKSFPGKGRVIQSRQLLLLLTNEFTSHVNNTAQFCLLFDRKLSKSTYDVEWQDALNKTSAHKFKDMWADCRAFEFSK